MNYTGIHNFSDFFQGIARGLTSTGGQQRLIIILIVAFVLLSLTVYLVQRAVSKRRIREEAEITFRNSLKNVDFTPEEREILEMLTRILPNGREKKYLIVQDAAVFSVAAEKLLATGEADPIVLKRLRNKLDVCCFRREKKLLSTKELPEGLHVYIITTSVEGYHGTLVQQKHDFFTIRLKETAEELQKGTACSVFFKRRKETYRVTSSVKYRKKEYLYLGHGEEIEKVQKRNYYRKQTSMPVALKKEGYESAFYHTKLFDIGGGGAKIVSPGLGFYETDSVVLMLEFEGEEKLEIPGEILKISEKDGVSYLHIQFNPMSDTQRDRLIGLISRQM